MDIIIGLFFGMSIFGGIGFYLLFKLLRWRKKCTCMVKAVVVKINEKLNDDGDILYSQTFEYTVCGTLYTVTSKSSSGSNPFKLGDTVDIKYNPENPSESYNRHDLKSFIWMVIFLLIITSTLSVIMIWQLITKIGNL